jgi:hypothetical protein
MVGQGLLPFKSTNIAGTGGSIMRGLRALLILSSVVVAVGPAAGAYREMPVENGGSVTGHVRVSGDVPTLPPQPVFKQHEVCGTTLPDERLMMGANRALRNAVVSLTDITAGKPVPRDRAVVLDNVKCAFVPHVASASVGQMLNIHNKDPFLHDAHALLGERTLFNVAVPKGMTVRKPLAYAGLIHINCNVRHTWMHAYLFVAEHPYHTVTGDTGQFVIDGIPPGTYTLRVWHELLGSVERQVTVQAGNATSIDVALEAVASESQ